MKIGINIYQCGFCGDITKRKVKKHIADNKQDKPDTPGRHTTTEQLICSNCGRYINQRSKDEI